ncbi:MAG: hypothetical protein ACOY40_00190 [Bacillota bacterium]
MPGNFWENRSEGGGGGIYAEK